MMGHRLSKIYTRTGDTGTTALGDGSRVDKDHPRVEAYGTVDELNSVIGLILAFTESDTVRRTLTQVQHDLFDLGGALCLPGTALITDAHVTRLEQALDRFNEPLPPLKEFILPGGGRAAAACHLARTVCRRAERRVLSLMREQTDAAPHGQPLVYLNRLSDLLFVIARMLAREEGQGEVLWSRKGN